MDNSAIAVLLQSEDTQKQLQALKLIITSLCRNIVPSEECLNLVIERGCSSEKSHEVRSQSFLAVKHLYDIRISSWNEVRAAILTEIGTAENVLSFVSAIQILDTLPPVELIGFVGSKEGLSALKSCLFFPNSELRLKSIDIVGKLLVKIYITLESEIDIESLVRVEAAVDAKRLKDDIKDELRVLIKSCSEGIFGNAIGPDPANTLEDTQDNIISYFGLLEYILSKYNESQDILNNWVDSLLGKFHTSSPLDKIEREKNITILLVPLLSIALPILCVNPLRLLHKWRLLSCHPTITAFISHLVIALLQDTTQYSTSRIGLEIGKLPINQFAIMTDIDDTKDSCKSPLRVNVVQFASEWMVQLVGVLKSTPYPSYVINISKWLLRVGDDHRLTRYRHQVCPSVTENLLRILSPFLSPKALLDGHSHDQKALRQIIPEALSLCLLAARFVPRDTVLASRLPTVALHLDNPVVDEVVRTKLLGELAMLLLSEPNIATGAIAQPNTLQRFLSDRHLVEAINVGLNSNHSLGPRLSTALLRTAQRLLSVTVSRLHKVFEAIQDRQTNADSETGGALIDTTVGSFSPVTEVTDIAVKADGLKVEVKYLLTSIFLIFQNSLRYLTWWVVTEASHNCSYGLIGEAAGAVFISFLQDFMRLIFPLPVTPTTGNTLGHVEAVKKAVLPTALLEDNLGLISEFKSWIRRSLADKLLDNIHSLNLKYQFIQLLLMYSKQLFVSDGANNITSSVGAPHSDFLHSVILFLKEQLIPSSTSTSTMVTGLGRKLGSIGYEKVHSYSKMPSQKIALQTLEILMSQIEDLGINKEVLALLGEFRTASLQETQRQQHELSSILLEQAEITCRRILENSSANGQESLRKAVNESSGKLDKRASSRKMNAMDVTDELKLHHEIMPSLLPSQSQPQSSSKDVTLSSKLFHSIGSLLEISDGGVYDQGNIFGMFSKHSSVNGQWIVASADVIALIDDVVNSHLQGTESPLLPPSNKPNHESLTASNSASVDSVTGVTLGLQLLHDCVNDSDCGWEVISGSTDLVTVLCSYCPVPSNSSVTIKTRVVNSSGFKIPNFSLELMLKIESQLQDGSVLPAAIGNPNSLTLQPGVEYFFPGSIIERHFTVYFHKFVSTSIICRMNYPDVLMDDPKAFFSFQTSRQMTSDNHSNSYGDEEATSNNHNHHPDAISRLSTVQGNAVANSITSIVSVDSGVMPLSCSVLLLPYGAGSLSSLSFLSNAHLNYGICGPVYFSLWNRLIHSVSIPIVGAFPEDLQSCSFIEALDVAIRRKLYYTKNSTSVSSRVNLGSCGSDWSGRLVGTAAWCCQSWWGDEVAFRITACRGSYSSHPSLTEKRSILWSGSIDIRVSEESLLSMLSLDVDYLLDDFTGGLFIAKPLEFSDSLPLSTKSFGLSNANYYQQALYERPAKLMS